MKDFSSQKDIIEKCKKQTKNLNDCTETLEILRNEDDKYNPYIAWKSI